MYMFTMGEGGLDGHVVGKFNVCSKQPVLSCNLIGHCHLASGSSTVFSVYSLSGSSASSRVYVYSDLAMDL